MDTLVVVVCLMADTPRIQRVEQIPVRVEVKNQPCNCFKRSFELSDSLFRVASEQAAQSATQKTRFERYRALDIISAEKYRFLKQGELELEEMKRSNRNAVKP